MKESLKGCHFGAVIAFTVFSMVVVGLLTAIGAALAGPIGAFVANKIASALTGLFVNKLSKGCS